MKYESRSINSQLFTTVYSEAERNAVGVYTVEIDETNKKDSVLSMLYNFFKAI